MSYYLSEEQHLVANFAEKINPFWREHVERGSFISHDNLAIHYAWALPESAKSCIVLSPGRIESYLKYQEFMHECWVNKIAIFVIDHRGQGLSGRMTSDPHHGYVRDFNEYVDDLAYFVEHIVRPNIMDTLPLNLVCHSMGGAIGTLLALKHPDWFAQLILCSPMFAIHPRLPNWLGSLLLSAGLFKCRLQREPSAYFFGQAAYQSHPFGTNKLTHSDIRYKLFRDLYDREANIQLGGVTVQWLVAATKAMRTIAKQANQLSVPVTLFSAAADAVVDSERQVQIARSIPYCEIIEIADARHELLNESDEYRMPVVQAIFDKSTKIN